MDGAKPRITSKLIFFGLLAAGGAYLVREKRRTEFTGKNVLIAGASRGLGLELARAFADERANLILLARDPNRLEQAAREIRSRGTRSEAFSCDLTRHEQVRQAVAAAIDRAGPIDVLVNVAGTIQVGPVEHMSFDDYADAMAIHFWAPLYLMQEIVPHMRRQGGGRIVNVASIGGKIAVPHLVPYCASKFALVGLSEGMRAELLKDRIYVTTVCPGLMRTGSHLNAFFKGQHRKEFALFSLANASPLLSIGSETAAREIVEACRYGQAELTITLQARALRALHANFPALIAESMGLIARLLPKPNGAAGDVPRRGGESRSAISPSLLTRPADRVVARNQE